MVGPGVAYAWIGRLMPDGSTISFDRTTTVTDVPPMLDLAGTTMAPAAIARSRWSSSALAWLSLAGLLLPGCAALFPHHGIPAKFVADEIKAPPREPTRTIDLSLLRQSPPAEYRLSSGDVLGIYIDGVLGSKDEVPPVHFPSDKDLVPSIGYPISVREDGTITLPMLPPLAVHGLSLRELEERLRHAYTVENPVLRPGMERILVSLHKPRTVRVLVMRQEEGNTQSRPIMQPESPTKDKRGVGKVVALPAYRNDVLNALAESGGLPGQDADNVVYIMRRCQPPHPAGLPAPLYQQRAPSSLWPVAMQSPQALPMALGDITLDSPEVVKIPLRVYPGDSPGFTEDDIILEDGDVVFLESRENEYFFTAGLLGNGQFSLPRDHDLDVLGALTVAESSTRATFPRPTKSIGGITALNQDITVSASKVIVFRKLADGREVPIKIDLYRAMRDPSERILIQPGDRVVLQYSRIESAAAFIERHLFEGFLIGAATTFLYNRD
jgi:protein involved in polysaccharide export with SLBB domain